MTRITASKGDEAWMQRALQLARRGEGLTRPNPPVGAVAVSQGKVVGEGYHRKAGGPHAEVVALGKAGSKARGCTLYVTLEPCAMCAGAILHARIARVVYGARDPKTGVHGSVVDLFAVDRLNHHTEILGGILAEDCAGMLSGFFASRRRARAQ